MNKKLTISGLTLLLLLVYSFTYKTSLDDPDKYSSDIEILDYKFMDFNQIRTIYRNNGNFNRNPITANSGFEWTKGSNKYARYGSGIWMGAMVNSQTLVAVAFYSSEFRPGYIDTNGDPQGWNEPAYKIYNVYSYDTSSFDYQQWPVNQGAYLNNSGRPHLLGNQTMFYSYSDGYPEAHTHSIPLKAQVLQHDWCYNRSDLENVIFTDLRIINRSNQTWSNAFIGLWTDDDLGDSSDDVVGVDSVLNLGYTYNFTNNDSEYGSAPPAVGFVLLKGAISFTGNNSDTAKYYYPPGTGNLKIKPGYKEQPLNSFNMFVNSGSPLQPTNAAQIYNTLKGLRRDGTPWTSPSGFVSNFPYSGDPETNTGWLQSSGTDVKFLMNIGPITVAPNDTQIIRYAQVIARGTSNKNSVTKLKTLASHVKSIYNSNFSGLVSVRNISSTIPGDFMLYQNYPNPFNPSTKIKFDVKNSSQVRLQIFDVTGRMISEVLNQKFEPGTYEYNWDASGFSSGTYFYKIDIVGNGNESFSNVKKMILLK
jgi:hypothetical protein